jgi:predicted ATPase
MLFKIIFKKDWRCFKKDQEFTFRKGINLLVGDQGSGKSSLLNVILRKDNNIIKIDCKEKYTTMFHDFEKNNPRQSQRLDDLFKIATVFSSHGETVNAILKSLTNPEASDIIFMDEPDMALSVRSIQKLINTLKSINNKHVIAAVHNPFLIREFDVLSVEHNMWMSGNDFIKKHLESAN